MECKQFQQIELEDKSQKLKYRFHSKKKIQQRWGREGGLRGEEG